MHRAILNKKKGTEKKKKKTKKEVRQTTALSMDLNAELQQLGKIGK